MTEAEDAAAGAGRRQHPLWLTWRRLLRHRLFVSGLVLFGVILIAAVTFNSIIQTRARR